jgi:hypothetical protein
VLLPNHGDSGAKQCYENPAEPFTYLQPIKNTNLKICA